jgi:phospholipid N-methyltransferase
VSGLYDSYYSRVTGEELAGCIVQLLGPISTGTILEVGAGQGNNVPTLREAGFTDDRIFLNELRPERIEAAARSFPQVRMFVGDALRLESDMKFDVVFQSTVFTSILAKHDREALATRMWSLLKPGGHILWYDFTYNNPKNPNVRKVERSEVASLFPHAKWIHSGPITLAPPIGRRVGRLYRMFNFPFLRTHLIALLQKPEGPQSNSV